jgi:hypothetical protein
MFLGESCHVLCKIFRGYLHSSLLSNGYYILESIRIERTEEK